LFIAIPRIEKPIPRYRVRNPLQRSALAILTGFLLGAAARAETLEIPAGPLPAVDGAPGAGEWKEASAARATGVYRARFRLARGRVLCIAVEADRGYEAERIDLHVADPRGVNYSVHTFHPACGVPGVERIVVAPVLTRHTSWALRKKTRMSPPLSCLFRARVLREENAWSAEIAVDLAALDVSAARPVVMRLDIVRPAEGSSVPLLKDGRSPAEWTVVRAPWDAGAPPLDIPEEDERRTFELDLFRELTSRVAGRPPRKPLMGPALDETKSRERIDALLARLDGCLEADPGDFFASLLKAHVLRRTHRFEEAAAALAATRKRFPELDPSRPPYAAEAFALAIARNDFDAAVKFRGLHRDQLRQWQLLRAAWKREQARRAAEDERGDLPRVRFESARGPVVVVLHEDDHPNAVAHVVRLVEAGGFAKRRFRDITGGLGGAVRARAGEGLAKARLLGRKRRRAWRGTLAVAPVDEGARAGREFVFATGPAFLQRELVAVGRVVEGQKHLDSLEIGDAIHSARIVRKRDHAYEVRR